jgi:hypothetical protein
MIHRIAGMLCLVTGCAGAVVQDPIQDPGTIPDASTDAPVDVLVDASSDAPMDAPVVVDAGSLVIGRPCATDSECGGGEMRCHLGPPGGYCTIFCMGDAECPTGSVCSPVPFSRVPGICMKSCATAADCRTGYACDVVYLFPGDPNSPSSPSPVCWESKDGGP